MNRKHSGAYSRPSLKQQCKLAWSMMDVRYGAIATAAAVVGQLLLSIVFWALIPNDSSTVVAVAGTIYSLISVVFHGIIGAYVFYLVAVLLPRLHRHYENVKTAADDVDTLRINARCFRECTQTTVTEGTDPLVDAYMLENLHDRELPIALYHSPTSRTFCVSRPVHEAIKELAMIASQKCTSIKDLMGANGTYGINTDLLKALNKLEYTSFRVHNSRKHQTSYPQLIQHMERVVQAFDKAAHGVPEKLEPARV